MIKSITNFLIIFFIFQQLKSQISQIDQNGYNAFCDETLQITLDNITSKKIYAVLVTKISNLSLVREKIINIHKYDFSEKEIIFNRPRWCTLSSRLREFQFKLLHGIVYTNHHLQKFNFVDSNLCSFCKKYDETYQHLLYACEATQKVWKSCSNLFDYIDLRTLVWEDIQFGLEISEKGKGQLLNHILILIQFFFFFREKKK